MEIIYLTGEKINMNETICSAVGFFDGLHQGHMKLVYEVKRIAQQKNYKTALMTFDHHPLYILGKIAEEKYMTSMDDRIRILEQENIDYLFIIKFSKDVTSLSPEEFISKYIVQSHIKHVVCGFDFRFGNKNSGDSTFLKQCPYIDVSVIDEVIDKGEKISSTRLRKLLDNGDIKEVNHLLGRNYSICGEVIKGRQIGHSIGFPTANINYSSYLLPQRGVYIVKVRIHNNEYLGMCNIGLNPTFTALNKPSLEVYILDFHQDIYGQDVIVDFYDMIRKEVHFHSKEELVHQLYLDQEEVRKYFQNV